MPTIPTGTGQPLTVPVGTAVQVPISPQGVTVINTGVVTVYLSPVEPFTNTPIPISPNGALPWAGNSTLYAQVNGTTPGSLYVVAGVSSYNPGGSTPGSTPGNNIITVGASVAAGGNLNIDFPRSSGPLWQMVNWGWWVNASGQVPISGAASLFGSLVSNASNQMDTITFQEGASNRIKDMVITANPTVVADTIIYNQFDKAVNFFINASAVG